MTGQVCTESQVAGEAGIAVIPPSLLRRVIDTAIVVEWTKQTASEPHGRGLAVKAAVAHLGMKRTCGRRTTADNVEHPADGRVSIQDGGRPFQQLDAFHSREVTHGIRVLDG